MFINSQCTYSCILQCTFQCIVKCTCSFIVQCTCSCIVQCSCSVTAFTDTTTRFQLEVPYTENIADSNIPTMAKLGNISIQPCVLCISNALAEKRGLCTDVGTIVQWISRSMLDSLFFLISRLT